MAWISHNCIADKVPLLDQGPKNCTNLSELNLGGNITSDGISVVLQIIKCEHLQSLDVSFCDVGDKNVSNLVKVLCEGSLRNLNLSNSNIKLNDASILGAGLKSFEGLVELNISYNYTGSHGVIDIAHGLKYYINLRNLHLSDNNISSLTAVLNIVDVMKTCRYLQKLDLISNNIGVEGAVTLVSGWQHKSMLSLHLSSCLGEPHESNLREIKRCCNSCDHLLEVYYSNDYIVIHLRHESIPKMVS